MNRSYTPDPDRKWPKPGLRSRLEDILHKCLCHDTQTYLLKGSPYRTSLINPKDELREFIRSLKNIGALAKLGKAVPDSPPFPLMGAGQPVTEPAA